MTLFPENFYFMYKFPVIFSFVLDLLSEKLPSVSSRDNRDHTDLLGPQKLC